MSSSTNKIPAAGQREFARIEVQIPALVQPLDESRAQVLRTELATRPSVWAPGNETTLRNLAATGTPGAESLLAQAILDLTAQIVRLQARVLGPPGPVKAAVVRELSGGGGRLTSSLAPEIDDLFELRFNAEEEVPPLRALIRIVHDYEADGCGFKFEAIHPRDQDLLVRLIYSFQRQALREQRDSP